MSLRERCSEMEVRGRFSGTTPATVELVSMPHSGQFLVRKREVTPVDPQQETTQTTAVFLDHVLFHSSAQLVAVSRCEEACVGHCSHSPYIDGDSIESVLGDDHGGIAIVDGLRRRLLLSMQSGGYFDQQYFGSPRDFYVARFGKHAHNWDGENTSHILTLGGRELHATARAAYHYLKSELDVPLGLFPNDLNSTNVLYRSSDDALRVIDQKMAFTSPVVVWNKLLVGWRAVAMHARKKQGWSEFDVQKISDNLEETRRLDRQFLAACLSYYHHLPSKTRKELLREVAAVQIVKTHLTLLQYQQMSMLPSIQILEEVLSPFFLESCRDFE